MLQVMCGAPSGFRTPDPLIKSQCLSYDRLAFSSLNRRSRQPLVLIGTHLFDPVGRRLGRPPRGGVVLDGSIYYAAGRRLWCASISIPNPGGTGRHRKTVTARLFCDTLRKFSDLRAEYPPRTAAPSRQDRMLATQALHGTHTAPEWYAKLRAQKGICHYCGELGYRWNTAASRWFPELVQDHMTPIARGGADTIDNVVGACEPCNRRKGTMTAPEYFAALPALRNRREEVDA